MRCRNAGPFWRSSRLTIGLTAVAVIVAAGCGSTPASSSQPTSRASASRQPGPRPAVNAAAFVGHGELAFVSRGHLWVLDGRTGALHQVATPGMAPLDPAFSPDGRWLAFLASSPSASEYAVWSPDGSSVAVSVSSVSAGTLASYPLSGGQPTVWLRLPARGGMNYVIDLAGWWRPLGIGFWAGGNCASCNADGDPFYIILMPGSRPRLRGTTLADPSLDQVAAASNGRLAIVAETRGPGMGGRLIWQDRAVKVCGPAAAACTAVALPASDVTLDPAWSPNGTQLAFVRAPFRASAGFPQKVVAAWY